MSRKLLVGTLILAAGILVVVFQFRPSAVYSLSVSEFLAHPRLEQLVRVQGTFVRGSLCRRDNPCEYRFRLAGGWSPRTDAGRAAPSAELSVRYRQCIIPDTFRESNELTTITVEGEMCASCHRFEASTVFARMITKYEMYEMKAHGQALPPPSPPQPPPLCSGS
jgi:cytochrome c-type biogenesis protein CcmE